MNLGVETEGITIQAGESLTFQHSLMNLGVETRGRFPPPAGGRRVSAFSDESWGGDHLLEWLIWRLILFQHSLMNLGVETVPHRRPRPFGRCFSIL